ncbi:MAG: helix-turn-helix domain-containing protein [Nanoarchaeota archaeon]|nr:helix-turn-helix domain-containing protein [Nanoarchaeota archaeon]
MTEKKFLLISLEDEKVKHLSEVLGNKTCKKIIDLLAEKELSEQDISKELKSPLNTIEYNLKKLEKAELIEKSKNFFWSKKGKKIIMYKLSNKSIVISPKKSKLTSKLKSIVPTILVGGIGAIAIKYLTSPITQEDNILSIESAATIATSESFSFVNYLQSLPNWYWFSFGIILAVIILTILNWRKL